MFYLCTIIQGAPKRIKLIQMQKERLDDLKKFVRGDDDLQWIEDENAKVIYGKSKMN